MLFDQEERGARSAKRRGRPPGRRPRTPDRWALRHLPRGKRQQIFRRRRRAAIGLAGALLLVGLAFVVLGGGGSGEEKPRLVQLPGGGRTILPEHRVVAYYGAPQDDELGALGIGTPAKAAKRLKRTASRYETRNRPVLPAFELIATVVGDSPGDDNLYSTRQRPQVIERYLRAARKANMILILDIQPGHRDFMEEVAALEPYLREPDVSLALDPEWNVGPDGVPGQVIGSVDADVVNQVSDYLSKIVRDGRLPQKMLVVHQFTEGMIKRKSRLKKTRGVALVGNVDGVGDPADKIPNYREFSRDLSGFYYGFKLFFKEDTNLLSPPKVLKLKPSPNFIVYE